MITHPVKAVVLWEQERSDDDTVGSSPVAILTMVGYVALQSSAEATLGLAVPITQIVVGIVVTVVGGIYVWNYKEEKREEETESQRLDKIETAVFGVDDVETMEGVVEVMDSNYKQTEENAQRLDELREKVQEIEHRQEKITSKVEEVQKLCRIREEKREEHNDSSEDTEQ